MANEYDTFLQKLQNELSCTEEFISDRYRFSEEDDLLHDKDKIYIECGSRQNHHPVCGFFKKQLFDHYQNQYTMPMIIGSILRELHRVQSDEMFDLMEQMDNYEVVKDRLFIRLLNYEQNRDKLEKAVYRLTGDIAQVLYLKASEDSGCLTSCKVSGELIRAWGKTEDEVIEMALLNTYFLSPPRVVRWENLLFGDDYEGENFMDLMRNDLLSRGPHGNCITTKKKTNGAVAAFLPGVLPRIASLLDSDLYLAFTSIHEVMVHAEDRIDPLQLSEVLKDTIRETTADCDFLSDKLYRYDRETGEIECLSEERLEQLAQVVQA